MTLNNGARENKFQAPKSSPKLFLMMAAVVLEGQQGDVRWEAFKKCTEKCTFYTKFKISKKEM
jgi:hypothetical protein